MAYKMMVVFAVSLAVAMVTASLLGDLCFEACSLTEREQQECLQGCPQSGSGRSTLEATSCEEKCVEIGATCRMICVNNFDLCKQECSAAEPDIYDCVVTCVRTIYEQSTPRTAK